MDIEKFWDVVLKQDANELRGYFHPDACIYWHGSNERFSVEEFIIANCEYPGEWDGQIERIEKINSLLITVTHVYSKDMQLSFHVVSFITLQEDKIIKVDEYWGEDGDAPKWRKDKHIGTTIC